MTCKEGFGYRVYGVVRRNHGSHSGRRRTRCVGVGVLRCALGAQRSL